MRYLFWFATILVAILGGVALTAGKFYLASVLLIAGLPLALLGLYDFIQQKHSLLRVYPVIGRLRYIAEGMRKQIQQYFVESDTAGVPFSRNHRSVVYQRAKGDEDDEPFGTELNTYADDYEWLNHSIVADVSQPKIPRVMIGNAQCSQPYEASVFNISAMSYGSLGAHAIEALNKGAAAGGFAHDTGEGAISEFHRKHGGDLIWEIGTGYFGCRLPDGGFDAEMFAKTASNPQVKMIEIKLSQGAKPGHGGLLPAAKINKEISEARGVPMGKDCNSPASHREFSTPIGLMEFIVKLRDLSGGKPIGFKLCVGHRWEFMAICKAMLATNVRPDFIVVDGGEGGTGAAPPEFPSHIGTPLRDGLLFVRNALVGAGLKDDIKLGASGKVTTGFGIASNIALGADWCNSARGFMFSLGCLQSQTCHTGDCPTGITTHDPLRQRGLNVNDKAKRVASYHKATVESFAEILAATGADTVDELLPCHLFRRKSVHHAESWERLYPWLANGELLKTGGKHAIYEEDWKEARADTFAPQPA